MTRDEFQQQFSFAVNRVTKVVCERNREYTSTDALACWRKRGFAGIAVRMEDKMQRLSAFVDHGGATPAAWRELFGDLAGYALCALVWLEAGDDPMVR